MTSLGVWMTTKTKMTHPPSHLNRYDDQGYGGKRPMLQMAYFGRLAHTREGGIDLSTLPTHTDGLDNTYQWQSRESSAYSIGYITDSLL